MIIAFGECTPPLLKYARGGRARPVRSALSRRAFGASSPVIGEGWTLHARILMSDPCYHAPNAQEAMMKLILSRKGFDSKSGGCPSPIFPGGAMFSLPIPDSEYPRLTSRLTYRDLPHPKADDIGRLVEDLTGGNIRANRPVHMSPDLTPPDGCPRLFDQVKAAVGHLNNQGVKEGDLFLFFGLFQRVECVDGHWKFIKGKPQKHVLWGWLQVGEKHEPKEGEDKLRCMCGNNNTRYVASTQLDLCDGLKGTGVKGAGVFSCFDDRLLLT